MITDDDDDDDDDDSYGKYLDTISGFSVFRMYNPYIFYTLPCVLNVIFVQSCALGLS